MSVEAGSVELELILTGLQQVQRDLKGFERQAKRSTRQAEKGFNDLNRSIQGFGKSILGIAGALGAGAFLRLQSREALDFDRAVTKLNATLGKDGTQVIICRSSGERLRNTASA